MDIACPIGTPVLACADGVVLLAGTTPLRPVRGIHIILSHEDNIETHYYHLSAVNCQPFDSVRRGQVIGWSGDSGGVAAHLHWSCRDTAHVVDDMRGFRDPLL